MARKKSSDIVAYRVTFRYIGPQGDARYSSLIVESSDETEARAEAARRLSARKSKLRWLAITGAIPFDRDQLDMWSNPGHGS